ncbi:gamma-glutamyltransferase family protein [Hyphococcus sp.]|uniref:gamma-glutamyltransferase family protein n=1 Tax=Hyphococcus sp. TaxID=2038636 RepID=UPI003CCC278B
MNAKGGIATPHAAATEAGIRILEAGGNAIDAAISAAAVLTVIYPHQCAIGGDLFALVHDRRGKTTSVNGSGVLPAGVDVESLRAAGDEVPSNGVHSITIPGMVAGWKDIAGLGAVLSPAEQLETAITLAENGAEISPSLARGIQSQSAQIETDAGLGAVFMDGGAHKKAGDRFRQPALASTLQSLASDGFDAFYNGPVAENLVNGLQSLGAAVTVEDFRVHASKMTAPLQLDLADLTFLTSPPNSQGIVLLETIAALDSIGIGQAEIIERPDFLLAASIIAAGDRDLYLGDPDYTDVPLDKLLDKSTLKARFIEALNASEITLRDAAPAHGDTVSICAMDAQGNAVSLIQSVYQTFGAGILEPETGVIMHNRARGFSLEKGAPNEMKPGARPAHTLTPLLVLREGTIAASIGTMGGRAQPQILAQILPGVLNADRNLCDVLAAPRWVFGGADIGFDRVMTAIERDAPDAWDAQLERAGLPIEIVSARDDRMGHSNAVRRRRGGGFESASDVRSDGVGLTC